MALANTKIKAGAGSPVLIFDGGNQRILPEPQGSGRDGLRVYDFRERAKSQYISQGDNVVRVGVLFQFVANMFWEPMEYKHLKYLFDAQNEKSFILRLYSDIVDNDELEYRCRVVRLSHTFYAGLSGEGSPGYSVRATFEAVKLSKKAGYGALNLGTGYGTGYGTDYGNQ